MNRDIGQILLVFALGIVFVLCIRSGEVYPESCVEDCWPYLGWVPGAEGRFECVCLDKEGLPLYPANTRMRLYTSSQGHYEIETTGTGPILASNVEEYNLHFQDKFAQWAKINGWTKHGTVWTKDTL